MAKVFNTVTGGANLAENLTARVEIGVAAKGDALAEELGHGLRTIRERGTRIDPRPRVYFEEWDDPMISGIRWVSELIGIAGGEDCFPELAGESLATNRIVADPAAVIERRPDIIIGSWCGKKFRPERVAARRDDGA